MWMIILLIVVATFAPLISPMEPNAQVLEYPSKPSMFRGNVILKKNPMRSDEPFVIAVESFSQRGDSVE